MRSNRLIADHTGKRLLILALAPALVVSLACNRSASSEKEAGKDSAKVDVPPVTTSTEVTRPSAWETLKGRIGSSSQWDSGWIDLDVMTDFKKGDKLKLRIGGTAHQILVRFLSKGANPDDAVGIDGDALKVLEDRVVQLTLEEDHANVVQISVHGGPNPWGLFPLDGDNGPATILNAQRITP